MQISRPTRDRHKSMRPLSSFCNPVRCSTNPVYSANWLHLGMTSKSGPPAFLQVIVSLSFRQLLPCCASTEESSMQAVSGNCRHTACVATCSALTSDCQEGLHVQLLLGLGLEHCQHSASLLFRGAHVDESPVPCCSLAIKLRR